MSSSSLFKESVSRHHSYSRKQKSLALLCSNFLSLYNRDDVESVGVDEAANRLGVERRRIYDIVNVLESVGVLVRKAKNQYYWKGFGAIPKALEDLKEEALKENSGNTYKSSSHYETDFDCDEDENLSEQNCKSSQDKSGQISVTLKGDNRREKSLGLLTQNFVKLFLTTKVDMISLDEAAKLLLSDANDSWQMRNNSAAKVRRLYDIANVLSSMNLIEKTNLTESRKPGFRWLGINGKSKNCDVSTESLNSKEVKKREFGTEITNIDFKSNKGISSVDVKPNKMQKKCEDWMAEINLDKMQQQQQQQKSSKTYVFGPFCPIATSTDRSTEECVRKVQDWETLTSSFRPQYRNQALMDLFAHYMEAWKSWYTEMTQGNNQPHNTIHKPS